MTTIYFLILTFFISRQGQISSVVIPEQFTSLQSCDAGGESARYNYNGGAIVNYTCVISNK